MNKLSTKRLCRAGVIAALYAALTYAFAPVAFGPFQLRPAEALCILPLFFPEAIPALWIGCMLANLTMSAAIWDVVFGSLATLLAAVGTYLLRKKPLAAAACPVIANGLIVGTVLAVSFGWPVALTMLQVALGETAAVLIGFVLLRGINKAKIDLTLLS